MISAVFIHQSSMENTLYYTIFPGKQVGEKRLFRSLKMKRPPYQPSQSVWQMSERQTVLRRLQQVSNLLLFCRRTAFHSL